MSREGVQDSQGLREGGDRGETKAQGPSGRERAIGRERERDTTRATGRERDRSTRSTERETGRSVTQSEREPSRSTATERSSRSGTTVNLNATQRTRISTAIRSAHVEPLRNVNFSVRVGAVVPASVHFQTLPAEVVEIVPQYRGYYYVLVGDEIVIIEPRTRKIVTVIEYRQASRTHKVRTHLSSRERQTIRSRTTVHTATARVSRSYEVDEVVPEDVHIYEFSEEDYEDVPAIRSYGYFPDERGDLVVVEPRERRVIDVID